MQSTQSIQESLERARALMRELIDRLQNDLPSGQSQTSASLSRILTHVENVQKIAGQISEESANAVKRLRDFANTIERIDLGGESVADARDIQAQLVAVLRVAADQIRGQESDSNSALGGEAALGS